MTGRAERRQPRPFPHASRRAAALALLIAVVVTGLPGRLARSAAQEQGAGAGVHEVGRLPVWAPPGLPEDEDRSTGWLIVNPVTRRGYQIFEHAFSSQPFHSMTVQSFDLDTFEPRRRAYFAGQPLVAGSAATVGSPHDAGEVVHAVDQKRGLVYVALSATATITSRSVNGPDGARPFARIVVIDEAAFDRGDAAHSATFREPVAHLPLRDYSLKGMQLDDRGDHAQLLLLFAEPGKTPSAVEGLYAHMLTAWRWDPAAIPLHESAPGDAATQARAQAAWTSTNLGGLPGARRLESCSSVPIAADRGHYEWEMLATRADLHVVCQSGRNSAQVARLPRNAGGEPTSEDRPVRLGRLAVDVLADPSSGRLYLFENNGSGETWWVFDSKVQRFVGSVATMLGSGTTAAGVDPTRGRLYSLIPDHVFNKGTGTDVAGKASGVRGGFQILDGFLDPVPALENVDPGLAYPARLRIQVDPVRRRLFLRRGGGPVYGNRYVYPETDNRKMVPAPMEPFYRVLEDRSPLSSPPPPESDAAFTTQVDEAPGSTQASFLGEGAGFGSRVVLTGGLAAATTVGPEADNGLAGDKSPVRACATVDRELVVAQAASVSVSDLSTRAAGAGLDADPTTKADLKDPAARCWQMTHPTFVAWPGPSLEGYSFDRNADGHDDYLAECVDDRSAHNEDSGRARGFEATVTCRASEDRAVVSTSGAFRLSGLTGSIGGPIGVASSLSNLDVQRPEEGGVRVTVVSEARGIEVPLADGTSARIDKVRVEAASWARGRKRRAGTSFKRSICGVDLGAGSFRQEGCLTDQQQRDFANGFNERLGNYARVELREPDAEMARGTEHGYRAAVVRDDLERFTDQVLHRDSSLAVPGLEIVFYRGDSQIRGPGRQIYQFAGAQAAATYGIACVNGVALNGSCSSSFAGVGGDMLGGDTDDGDSGDGAAGGSGSGGGAFGAMAGEGGEAVALPGLGAASSGESGDPLIRLLRQLVGLPVDLARLLLSSPREFVLMAMVWLLLYWPCYARERRRSLRRLVASRMTGTAA